MVQLRRKSLTVKHRPTLCLKNSTLRYISESTESRGSNSQKVKTTLMMNKQNVVYKRVLLKEDTGKEGEGHVTEVDTASYSEQAKEDLEPPEAERGKEGFLHRGFEKAQLSQHLDFGFLACRTVTE